MKALKRKLLNLRRIPLVIIFLYTHTQKLCFLFFILSLLFFLFHMHDDNNIHAWIWCRNKEKTKEMKSFFFFTTFIISKTLFLEARSLLEYILHSPVTSGLIEYSLPRTERKRAIKRTRRRFFVSFEFFAYFPSTYSTCSVEGKSLRILSCFITSPSYML